MISPSDIFQFTKETIYSAGFILMKSEHSAIHSEIISIFKNNQHWESEIFGAIYENLEDMNSLVNNKISLASVIGLFQLVEISQLISFINLESIMKYFLPRLMPNYSKIVPGGIMEDRRLPDHLIGASKESFIEDFKIDDFRPRNLEKIEWESLQSLFSIIGRSKLLSGWISRKPTPFSITNARYGPYNMMEKAVQK